MVIFSYTDYRIIINTGSVTMDSNVDTKIACDAISGLQSYLSANIAVVLAMGMALKSTIVLHNTLSIPRILNTPRISNGYAASLSAQ